MEISSLEVMTINYEIVDGLWGSIPHLITMMTKEERKEWYHDWYWNRGGREQTLQRRRERGPQKWGTGH